MPPRLSAVIREFFQLIGITDEPRPAVEWLTTTCTATGLTPTAEEAREWAEANQDRFLGLLRRELDQLTELGRPASFDFNSSSPYMIQGPAFVEPCDPPDIQAAKIRRARFADYVAALQQLEPLPFEALCAGILSLLGVERPNLTLRSGDEGIDFYGRLYLHNILPGDFYLTVEKQLAMWMIGQAKRYQAGQVSTPDIRELLGSIELAKVRPHGTASETPEHPAIKICDPVAYLFFTTGRISRDVWQLLARTGIVAMDGEMIAAFLAEREVGIRDDQLDLALFSNWIRTFQR